MVPTEFGKLRFAKSTNSGVSKVMTEVACDTRERSTWTDPKKNVLFFRTGPPNVADMSFRLNGS